MISKHTLWAMAALGLLAAGCSSSGGGDCPSGQTDCNGACVDLATDEANCGACGTSCNEGAGFICANGTCACSGDEIDCDGTCANTSSDPQNCGVCGNACAADELCSGGNCAPVSECVAPKKICGGSCVDVQSDNSNCGDCGVACDSSKGFSCVAGACACTNNLTDCSGACVDTNASVDHCGGCGNKCPDGQVCSAGTCSAGGCQSPLTDCGGACVDTSSDNSNCGGCGTKCETSNGFICKGGSCGCAIGTDCSGQCVDTQVDGNNCGACGTKCDPGQACLNGSCTIDCAPKTQCGNKCVDTQTDPDNCGSCGTACTGGKVCNAGTCGCPAALPDDCAGVCTDTQTDEANCDTCGNPCSAGESCIQGACTPAQVTQLSVACDKTSVPLGTKMACTATGVTAGAPVDLTADANLTWIVQNGSCADTGTISNTPPTKGQFNAADDSSKLNCTIEVTASYNTGSGTLTATPITLTLIQRVLLSIAISPSNPKVPYLENGGQRLHVNFKVVGDYDSGELRETHLVKDTGAGYSWTNGNVTTATNVHGLLDPVLQLVLADKDQPTTEAVTQVDVTYTEVAGDPNTVKTASTILTVAPGNATGASVQPATTTIPLGPVTFGLVVNFDNSFDFDVTDLCATGWIGGGTGTSWGPDQNDNPGFTKHYQGYCPDRGDTHSFLLHQVDPASQPPRAENEGTSTNFTGNTPVDVKLRFPKDSPAYTPRVAELFADAPTTSTPATVEANFWDGGYSVNRVFGRAQVTINDAALVGCRVRAVNTLPPPALAADDTDIIGDVNGNNTFPVNLMGHQIYVAGQWSNNSWKDITDQVSLTSSDDATVLPNPNVGQEGKLDMLKTGTVTLTATDATSGVTCVAKLVVDQGILCQLQVLPRYKGKVGRRAYYSDPTGATPLGAGPGQTSHASLNAIVLPNEDDWTQAYKGFAWYTSLGSGCPTACYEPNTFNSETREFEPLSNCGPSNSDPCCFKVDATDQGTWTVVPGETLTPADPALVSQGGGVFRTKASINSNANRVDYAKFAFGSSGLTTQEPVLVCGTPLASNELALWSQYADNVADASEAWIGVGGATTYEATLTLEGCDSAQSGLPSIYPFNAGGDPIEGYRLQITEDVSQWTSVPGDKADVDTAVNKRGDITGKAEGKNLITATYEGETQSLDINVGKVAVASCVVNVPRTELRFGGGVGERMQASVTVTLTNGNTVEATDELDIDFCDEGGGETCAFDYGTSNGAALTIRDDGVAWVNDASGATAMAQATCKGCGISATDGSAVDVPCEESEELTVTDAVVSGLHVQQDHLPCAATPLTSLTLNVGTTTDLKGCLTWDHGVLQSIDDAGASGGLTWGGGATVSPSAGGVITVNGAGANTINVTHAASGETADVSITATADKFASFAITGVNVGVANCPTGGCLFERMGGRFRLIATRAGGGTQDLTPMTAPGDWSDTEGLLKFDNAGTGPGFASGKDAPDNGSFTDTTLSVSTTLASSLCDLAATCSAAREVVLRVYDADPIQASIKLTQSATSATAGELVTISITAQPNGVTTPPDIDITHVTAFTADDDAALWCAAGGFTSSGTAPDLYVLGDHAGTSGECLAWTVEAPATVTVTATLGEVAIGGTATELTKETTITVNP